MPPGKTKAVFDCNIIWQSFFFGDGVSAKCRQYVNEGIVELFISREILIEIRDVMYRPELLRKFKNIDEKTIAKFIEELLEKSTFYRYVPPHFAFKRDPDDESYLNLAFEARVDHLVTRDRDLLDLMTDVDTFGKQFRQKTRPLKIIDPVEFLKLIKPVG